jgi:hypothetical protein
MSTATFRMVCCADNVLNAFRVLGNVRPKNVVFGSRQCAIALGQPILVGSTLFEL